MGTTSRRWAAAPLIVLAAAGWPLETAAAAAATRYNCPAGQVLINDVCVPRSAPAEPPPAPSGGHGHGTPWGLIGIGALVAGAAIIASQQAKGADQTSPDALRKNGPHLRTGLPPGTFAMDGFIADGWPVVIEYESKFDAVLTVTTKDGPVWAKELPRGRGQASFNYEGRAGPVVGLFTVQSRGPDPAEPEEPPPVIVYALGAGKSALAQMAANDRGVRERASAQRLLYSPAEPPLRTRVQNAAQAGISNLSFGPSPLTPPASATYSYDRRTVFQTVRGDILRYTWDWAKRENGQKVLVINTASVWHDNLPQLQRPGGSGDLTWDGRDQNKKLSAGRHRLQVRAWQSRGDPDWIAALSEQSVDVR